MKNKQLQTNGICELPQPGSSLKANMIQMNYVLNNFQQS